MGATSSPAAEGRPVAPDARVAGADADVLVVAADPQEFAGSDLTVTAGRRRRWLLELFPPDLVRAELLAVAQTMRPGSAALWLCDTGRAM